MSFITDIFSGGGADAAKDAASIQAAATSEAAEVQRQTTQDIIAAQERAEAQARADLAAFRVAGQAELGLREITPEPTAQAPVAPVATATPAPSPPFTQPFTQPGIDYTLGGFANLPALLAQSQPAPSPTPSPAPTPAPAPIPEPQFESTGEGVGDDLADIRDLIENPERQLAFIEDNAFFDALAQDAQDRLFANQAARGKVGSGETAKALQNSLVLLGADLLNQNIAQRNQAASQRLNLATLGANAAAGQATTTQQTASNVAGAQQSGANNIIDLITGGANAQAAGIVGAANAQTQGFNSLVNTGLGIGGLVALSDERVKDVIGRVGILQDGLPVYLYRFQGDAELRTGVMAQDVEQRYPEAIVEHEGLKYIDYARMPCLSH